MSAKERQTADDIRKQWETNPRWKGIKRTYTAEDVLKLRASLPIEYSLSRAGSERFWDLLTTTDCVYALGAMTGNQAVQQVRAGLPAIYVSGWQVAADANSTGGMYPDLSLYPSNSVPQMVKKINSSLRRADQIQMSEGKGGQGTYWYAPVVADAEAGFGGNLNVFEITKWMIEAGAGGVHYEDQLSSAKKCGHMGGKVLDPTRSHIEKLTAARLAADVVNVPLVIIARTDADAAKLITSDVDPRDKPFITGKRTVEGFFELNGGIDCAIARGVAYAPYCDLIWCETSHPDLDEAKRFADGVHKLYPGKLLAYNCSPSFNWKKKLGEDTIAKFRKELAAMGYKFQFITLAGFHSLNHSMFMLARDYKERAMSAYADFQKTEFDSENRGYQATAHQKFVGTSYFDQVAQVIAGGELSTAAMSGSTEEEQF